MAMEQSRRLFLKTSAGLGLLAGAPRAWAAAAASPAATRPGLLFGPADLPRIRATLDRPEFAAFWKASAAPDFAADERFLRDEIRMTNASTDLARAGGLLVRAAFVNAIAPDARQVRLARLALGRIMEFHRWDWILQGGKDTVGVMRGPSICVTLVLAADWLGDALTAAEQEAIIRRLGEDGGPACERAVRGETDHAEAGRWSVDPEAAGLGPLDVSHWPEILDRTNLRITATAGLAAVGCFLHGRHPQAEKWCEEGVASLRLFASRMPPDQSFPEYVGYWSYTFSFYCLALELLRRTRGIDERGLLDFPAMARYAAAMAAPTIGRAVDCINVGDSSASATAVPLSWIGREFRDGTAQFLIARPESVGALEATSSLAAIWFDAGVPARLAPDIPLDRTSAPGLVLSRSGWKIEDSVLCLRSGGPSNHEHADRNSVIFMAHGERLLNDPLHASYWKRDPKWLLRLTAAHTAVLIDGKGHVYLDDDAGTHSTAASATLIDHRAGPDWMSATSDAADAYRRAGLPAKRILRTVIFLKPEVLLVLDEVTLGEPLSLQVRFQAYNDDGQGKVRADGKSFAIDRPHARLRANFVSQVAATVSAGRLPLPADEGVYPFAEIAAAPALRHAVLTVCTAAPAGAEHGALETIADAEGWTVRGLHRGRVVSVRIVAAVDRTAPSIIL